MYNRCRHIHNPPPPPLSFAQQVVVWLKTFQAEHAGAAACAAWLTLRVCVCVCVTVHRLKLHAINVANFQICTVEGRGAGCPLAGSFCKFYAKEL